MIFLLLQGCTEYGYTDVRWTDVFQQDRANKVDLLIVVDNSCSMNQEQDNLARNFDALLQQFVHADVDWQIGVTTTDIEEDRYRGRLQGGDDELILRGPAGEIDRVEYSRSWGFSDGVSLVLSAGDTSPSGNDVLENWCPAAQSYGTQGERGTPGEQRRHCNGRVELPIAPGPDGGLREPVAGDLAFTELHPQSLGDDRKCEWLELTSLTDDSLQLHGIELFDRGRNHVVFPEFVVPPHASIVIGRSMHHNCGVPVDIAFAEGLSLNNNLRTITAADVDADELFAEAVSQGTLGSGIELGLESAKLNLSEPFYTINNNSWLRDDAKLALLFVSDEDDLSPGSVDEYLDFFEAKKGLQGYRDPQMFTVSSVVATTQPPTRDAPACISENGVAYYGERYLAAANRTGGLAESICATDFAPIVSELGLTLAGLSLEFALSRLPKLSTLKVSLYEDESNDSLIGELTRDEDFRYDVEANSIVFTVDQAPPSSTFLVVTYQVLPDGSVVEDTP